MDSPLLVIFCAIVVGVMLALVLLVTWFLWKATQNFREDAAKLLQIGTENLSAAQQRVDSSAERQSRSLSETTQQLLSTVTEAMSSTVSETVRTLDLAATRQLNGSQASLQRTTELFEHLAAHLTTKDTAGYERVVAASGTPIRFDPAAPPYTVPQMDEQVVEQEAAVAADQAGRSLLAQRLGGGLSGGSTGVFGPYSGESAGE